MTENSVANPHPSPQAVNPSSCELSWDDALDGNFPPTRQQRMQQAALQAAEQLQEQADLPVTHDRLTKALDLVLSNAVVFHQNNTASVRSGSRSYTVANGSCSCVDAKQRGARCKHQLAVEIHRRAAALIKEAPAASAPEAAAVVPLSAHTSAQWDVHEAPTSACFKFRVHTMELTYTFRGVDDAELQARIAETLPMLQAMMEACEDRHAVRQAEREAAKAVQAQPLPPQVSTPADLQQLVQQAVQHALAVQGGSQAAAISGQPPVPPPQEPPADTAEGYCTLHEVWMEQRSNERGSWYSHIATDDEGEYFCKGKGRTRRNGR
jgi:hypothetical protein